uniref:Spermatogenesis-associated protein 2 PUB-like domain-containing protein n=1 Tax=Leptobrachium leishanense TaxID=445787 RepID=A0A8C5MMA9_9ANUR
MCWRLINNNNTQHFCGLADKHSRAGISNVDGLQLPEFFECNKWPENHGSCSRETSGGGRSLRSEHHWPQIMLCSFGTQEGCPVQFHFSFLLPDLSLGLTDRIVDQTNPGARNVSSQSTSEVQAQRERLSTSLCGNLEKQSQGTSFQNDEGESGAAEALPPIHFLLRRQEPRRQRFAVRQRGCRGAPTHCIDVRLVRRPARLSFPYHQRQLQQASDGTTGEPDEGIRHPGAYLRQLIPVSLAEGDQDPEEHAIHQWTDYFYLEPFAKRFTGNFVYYIEPVIPGHTLKQILQKVGYTTITETEYSIGRKINTEEAKQAAFELFLSRIQCKELIQLIYEDKTDYAEQFFKETSDERDGGRECESKLVEKPSTDKNKQKLSGFSKVEGAKNLVLKSRIKELSSKGLEDKILEDPLNPPLCLKSSFDKEEGNSPTYYFSKALDSVEFINKYSDLNLAQKPIFPRQEITNVNLKMDEKKTMWIKPMTEESHNYPLISEYPPINSITSSKWSDETGWYKGRELVQEQASNDKGESDDKASCTQGSSTSNSEGNFGNIHSDSTVDYARPHKHGLLERAVIKLKMDKINSELEKKEYLTYPIEETLPPNCMATASGNEMTNSQWKFVKCRERLDGGTTSAAVDAGFCTPKVTFSNNKGVECSGDMENMSHLREPPNSTYIPPGSGGERHTGRISDIQPEEDQSIVQSTDTVQIEEAVYNMNTDSRDGFVIITKRENFQS